jgi:hypothetical protein
VVAIYHEHAQLFTGLLERWLAFADLGCLGGGFLELGIKRSHQACLLSAGPAHVQVIAYLMRSRNAQCGLLCDLFQVIAIVCEY